MAKNFTRKRDLLAKFTAASALIVTVVVFFWWQPGILAISALASVASVPMWLQQAGRRRVAVVAVLTVATGILSALAAAALDTLYTLFFLPSGLVGSREMVEHPSLVWVASTLVALVALVTAKVCAILHAWQAGEPKGDLCLE